MVPGLAATSGDNTWGQYTGTRQQHCQGLVALGEGMGQGNRQIALEDRCRGCKSVGSCAARGKGQFVAFK